MVVSSRISTRKSVAKGLRIPTTSKGKLENADSGLKSEFTRQRILDAAAVVFAAKGYSHSRLTDIATEAGSHAGGIYYYFDSRDSLVQEVLRIATGKSITTITAALYSLPKNATTEDRVRVATVAQLREILASDSYVAAFNKIYPQLPGKIKARHHPVLHEYFDIWRRIIVQGQAEGDVRSDIEPGIMRLTIAGSIQWAAEWAHAEISSPESLGEQMAAVFYSGISKRKAK
jgi:TetR/AcrR family transcriptional regulator, cholesterol catabolism regulator